MTATETKKHFLKTEYHICSDRAHHTFFWRKAPNGIEYQHKTASLLDLVNAKQDGLYTGIKHYQLFINKSFFWLNIESNGHIMICLVTDCTRSTLCSAPTRSQHRQDQWFRLNTLKQRSPMNNDALLIKYHLFDLLLEELMAGPASPKDWALLSPTGRRLTRAPRLHAATLFHKPASELELFKWKEECIYFLIFGSISPWLPEYCSVGYFLSKSCKQNPKSKGIFSQLWLSWKFSC